MKRTEKLKYLQDHHFSEWLDMKKKVDEELSKTCSLWCVCGKLCTGLHEMTCKKYQVKVRSETLKKLNHLLPDKKALEIMRRLDYLRGEIEAERISYSEIAELQSLAEYIDSDDVLLLEWAGIPECDVCHTRPFKNHLCLEHYVAST